MWLVLCCQVESPSTLQETTLKAADQQIQAFVPGREERFSYAALQPVSGILWYWQYSSSFSGFILGPNSVIGNSL
jgi:hypothetical protein